MVLVEGNTIKFKNVKNFLQYSEKKVEDNKIYYESLRDARAQFEIDFIKTKIKEYKGDLTKVATILEISKRQLNNKILEYNLREWINKVKEN